MPKRLALFQTIVRLVLLSGVVCCLSNKLVAIDFNQFASLYSPEGICSDNAGNIYVTSLNPDNVFEEYLTKYSSTASIENRIVLEHAGRLEYDPSSDKIWMLARRQFYLINPADLSMQSLFTIADLEINTEQIFDIATGTSFVGYIDPFNAFYEDFDLYRQEGNLTLFVGGFYQAWHFILRIHLTDNTPESAMVILTSGATLSPEDNSPHGIAVNSQGQVLTTLGWAGPVTITDRPVEFGADFPGEGSQPPEYLFDEYKMFTGRGMTTDGNDNFYIATGWSGGGSAAAGPSIIGIPSALDTVLVFRMSSLFANPRDVCVDQASGLCYLTDADADFFGDYDAIWTLDALTAIASDPFSIIPEHTLGQNFPNPFNSITTISFSLIQSGNVSLVVYDVEGRVVDWLIKGFNQAGNYQVQWDGSGLSSGIYFYRLRSNHFTSMRKMLLVK